MHRLAGSISPLRFGRRAPFALALEVPRDAVSPDAKLFLLTYAAGFLTVSLFIA